MTSYPDGIDGSKIHDFLCEYLKNAISLGGNYVPTDEDLEAIEYLCNAAVERNNKTRKKACDVRILTPTDFEQEVMSLIGCIKPPCVDSDVKQRFNYVGPGKKLIHGDVDVFAKDNGQRVHTIEVKKNGKMDVSTIYQIAKQVMRYRGEPVIAHLFRGFGGHTRISREHFSQALERGNKLEENERTLIKDIIDSDFYIDP